MVETVLSAQFDPLRSMTNAHLGGFWFERRSEWPRVAHQPPIQPQLETFDREGQWRQARAKLHLTQDPACRIQMTNASDDKMIQLQNDRLVYNWRRRAEAKPYPHYPQIKQAFLQAWGDLRSFAESEQLGRVMPTQWEVVYVNHIASGELWESASQWPKVVPGLIATGEPPLPEMSLEAVTGQWVYELASSRGRLYVDVAPGRSAEKPPRSQIVLRLTARGPIHEEGDSGLDGGLDLGHRVIVQSFEALTSPEAHSEWQRDHA